MINSKNVYFKSISELNKLITTEKWRNFFVVTGKRSYYLSGAERVILKLHLEREIRFSDFETNPQYCDIINGLKQFNNYKFDAIIAIGGGSVIDVAKLICYFQEHENLDKFFIEKGSGLQAIKGREIPLIAIPTTSGAGSESTHFAVLYKNKIKYSIANDSLLPDYYLLIPQLTYKTSPYLAAVSGIDAFCQAIESYWSVNSTSTSRIYAIKSIKILWKYLLEAVEIGSRDCRNKVQKGANLAGKAINISKTTAPHAISYTMTAKYGVAHGQAVCITLSHFLMYNYNVSSKDLNDNRGIDFVQDRILEIARAIDCKTIDEAQIAIDEFIFKLGLHTSLKSLSITRPNQLKEIKSNINLERLKNNPRKVTNSFIDFLFLKIQ